MLPSAGQDLINFWPKGPPTMQMNDAYFPGPNVPGPTEAIKHDQGKRDWALLPWDSVEEVVKVLEFGASKYAKHNWQQGEGFKYSRSFNALMRHMRAFMNGEDNDPETDISHLAHAMCNLMFMQHFVLNKDKYASCDDRQ